MATDTNPLIEMMRRIRLDIFDRSNRGALNYAGDTATLRKHLELAQEMGDMLLVAQTYSALGFVEQDMGYFTRAEVLFLAGIEAAKHIPEHTIYGALQNNLGEAYRRWGRSHDAILAYEKTAEHGKRIGDERSAIVATTNIGLSWLAINNYDEAEHSFLKVQELIKDNPWDHVSVLVEIKTGLAEVALSRGDFDDAWGLAEEAETLANGRNFQALLVNTLIVKAHIAEADPSREHLAHECYREARELLREHSTPILLARTLLDEARYQQRRGNIDDMMRLATEARTMFANLGLDEEVELAGTMVGSPALTV